MWPIISARVYRNNAARAHCDTAGYRLTRNVYRGNVWH